MRKMFSMTATIAVMCKLCLVVVVIICTFMGTAGSDTIMSDLNYNEHLLLNKKTLSVLIKNSSQETTVDVSLQTGQSFTPSIWPFSNKDGDAPAVKPKSTRKAFFLSLILPGLGEAYVGSKRSLAFLGVEAFSWWIYSSYTKKGEDKESEYRSYADTYWHYSDVFDSEGDTLDYDYFRWLKFHFNEIGILPGGLSPNNHVLIDSLLKLTVDEENSNIYGHSVHNLPPTKTQQYYEMIGKYKHFSYGWEDIEDNNQTIRQEDGSIKFDEGIDIIVSPMRSHYEDLRDDSNQKIKTGQRGVHLMIINRVVSAIDAARMAYSHNKKMDSELSQIRVQFVQKQIIDNKVLMLVISKKF